MAGGNILSISLVMSGWIEMAIIAQNFTRLCMTIHSGGIQLFRHHFEQIDLILVFFLIYLFPISFTSTNFLYTFFTFDYLDDQDQYIPVGSKPIFDNLMYFSFFSISNIKFVCLCTANTLLASSIVTSGIQDHHF